MRKVPYFVKRAHTCYWVYVAGCNPMSIQKKPGGWFSGAQYHKTLRDAIIYCAYGI